MNSAQREIIPDASIRYLAPFFVFLCLGQLQVYGDSKSVFWLYGVKVFLTALVFISLFRGHWRELEGKFDWQAVGVGVVCLIIWLLPYTLLNPTNEIAIYNPTVFQDNAVILSAIAVRLAGACLMVPIIEELLWRSFLMRILINQDFLKVSIGTYTHFSFWFTATTFALMHHPRDWMAAMLVAAIYGYYLVRTKNLIGCIVAHGTTNLGLGLYAMIYGRWELWN